MDTARTVLVMPLGTRRTLSLTTNSMQGMCRTRLDTRRTRRSEPQQEWTSQHNVSCTSGVLSSMDQFLLEFCDLHGRHGWVWWEPQGTLEKGVMALVLRDDNRFLWVAVNDTRSLHSSCEAAPKHSTDVDSIRVYVVDGTQVCPAEQPSLAKWFSHLSTVCFCRMRVCSVSMRRSDRTIWLCFCRLPMWI